MIKIYRLFSHNGLDGVGCGIIARLAFGDDLHVRYMPVNALDYRVSLYLDQETLNKKQGETLLITDLSVNKENERKIEEFVRQGGNVVLIDHHKSAVHLNQYSWAQVTVQYENGKLTCATSLLYDYLVQQNKLVQTDAVEEFVELIRQYDTWEWDVNQNFKAKQLNDLFFFDIHR